MATPKIKVNRAPVMTLWAAVVAEKLGFTSEEALSLGKAVTGLNAQAKGQRLGIYEPSQDQPPGEAPRQRRLDEEFRVEILGRPIPAVNTKEGVRAVSKGSQVSPDSARRYLESKFKDNLAEVRAALETLAGSYSKDELARRAYPLYEQFRPEIPAGKKGWGALGDLDLDLIRSLAKRDEE